MFSSSISIATESKIYLIKGQEQLYPSVNDTTTIAIHAFRTSVLALLNSSACRMDLHAAIRLPIPLISTSASASVTSMSVLLVLMCS